MKRNSLIIVVSILLLIIFGFWLCSFQVRTTEVAVVTTFVLTPVMTAVA